MALSIRSQTFHDLSQGIDSAIDAGEITSKEDIRSFVSARDIDFNEYKAARGEYKAALDEGLTDADLTARTFLPGRIGGRVLGEAGRGLTNFADMLLPEEASEGFSRIAENIGQALPEDVQKLGGELFDPYHGEGIIAGGEEIIGTIGSYLVPYTGIMKVGAAAGRVGGITNAGQRALLKKTLKPMDKKSRKEYINKIRQEAIDSEPVRRLASAAGKGTAFAAGTTMVESPDENIVNILRDVFPESTEYLERLAIDPEDSEASQYLQSFINNLGLSAVFSPIALASAYKKPLAAGVAAVTGPAAAALKKLPLLDKLPAFPAAFSSRLGTDDTTLALIQANSKAAEAGMLRAEGLASDLARAVKKEYGKKDTKIVDTINDAFENKEILNSLKPETRKIVSEMRENMTKLSGETMGGTKGELTNKINKNLDVYVTRSYDFFDDPAYKKQITKKFEKFMLKGEDPDGVFTSAIDAIAKTAPEGTDDVASYALSQLSRLIRGKSNEDAAGFLDGLLQHSSRIISTKSGAKKSDLPQSVRDLLGEVKDPYKNYVKTMTNLSRITSEQRFLKDMAQHLETKGLATEGVKKGTNKTYSLADVGVERLGKVFGRSPVSKDQVVNPLEGLYTTDVYRKAIREGLNSMDPAGPVMSQFMKAKGISQAFKTAFSPVTWGRNIMGNGFLMVANGFISPKGFGPALKATASKLRGKTNKELADQYAEYVELGVANSGVNVGVIKRNLNQFAADPDAAIENTIKSSNKLSRTNQKVLDIYQSQDDLFKIAHFEKTLDYIKRSPKYKNLSLAEKKQVAAQRTRDLMPNYALVPKAFKSLRGGFVSDFLSFPAEMVRVTKNIAKYSLQDIASGDAVLAAEGAKRLAGMTAVGVAGDALSDFSADMAGITSEQKEALDAVGADFEYGQNKIYLSGIDEDKNGRKGVDYLNLGYIDPFSYLKTMAKGSHELIFSGIINDELTQPQLEKLALGTLDKAVGPFLSPSMITEALMQSIGKGRTGATLGEDVVGLNLAERLEPVIDVFTPGIVDFIQKRLEYERSMEKVGDGVFPRGEAIKRGYATFKEGEVDAPAFIGLKRQRLDLTAGTRFNINPILKEIQQAGSQLEYELTDPNLTDPARVNELYEDAQKRKLKASQKLKSILDEYKTVYGDSFETELFRGLSMDGAFDVNRNTTNSIAESLGNMFVPYDLKPKPGYEMLSQAPIDYDALMQIRNTYGSLPIFQEEEE